MCGFVANSDRAAECRRPGWQTNRSRGAAHQWHDVDERDASYRPVPTDQVYEWRSDLSGAHEPWYFSRGQATKLVSDHGSVDERHDGDRGAPQ
jgi:hypothetical protein